MLEAVGVWELGWALNQFREQSHLSKSLTATVSSFFPLCLSVSAFLTHIYTQTPTHSLHHPKIFIHSPFTFCKRFKSQLVSELNPSDTFPFLLAEVIVFFPKYCNKMIQSHSFESVNIHILYVDSQFILSVLFILIAK